MIHREMQREERCIEKRAKKHTQYTQVQNKDMLLTEVQLVASLVSFAQK